MWSTSAATLPNAADYFAAFLRAAQRAFIISDSLFRPAAEIPPFLATVVFFAELPPAGGGFPFALAQRARWASAILLRASGLMVRLPRPAVDAGAADVLVGDALGEAPLSKDVSLCSRLSISSRIRTASCNVLSDRFIVVLLVV